MEEEPPPPRSLLPEIAAEVLKRLPERDLMRSKAVSKEWRSLISDPSFARGRSSLGTRRFGKLDLWGYPPGYITLFTFDFAKNPGQFRLNVRHNYNWWYANASRPCLCGSCNGLLFIQIPKSDAILWNPAMRSSTRIPPHGLKGITGIASGLGYDHTTDDYKALVFTGRDGTNHAKMRVFSLRKKSWTAVMDIPSDFAACFFRDGNTSRYDEYPHWIGTTIRGTPHWTAKRDMATRALISFDVVREEFVFVPLPEILLRKVFEFGELDGSLCVTLKGDDNNGSLEVWSMKEYGVAESWTKLLSFTPTIPFRTLKPVAGDLRKGEVVMLLDKTLSLAKFNVNDSSREIICSIGEAGSANYVESPTCPWDNEVD